MEIPTIYHGSGPRWDHLRKTQEREVLLGGLGLVSEHQRSAAPGHKRSCGWTTDHVPVE